MVFRNRIQGCPDIIAREIDVLPAERGQMDEELIRNLLDLAQGGNGAFKVAGIPEDNRGDEEVQAGGAMLLIFVGAVANFPEPMDEDGARQAVAGLALVKLTARLPAQSGVFEPIKRTIRERTSGLITSISRWSQPNWLMMAALSAVRAGRRRSGTFIELTPAPETFFVTFGIKSAFLRVKRQK